MRVWKSLAIEQPKIGQIVLIRIGEGAHETPQLATYVADAPHKVRYTITYHHEVVPYDESYPWLPVEKSRPIETENNPVREIQDSSALEDAIYSLIQKLDGIGIEIYHLNSAISSLAHAVRRVSEKDD